MATPPFGKIFGGHVRTVPGNTCVGVSNFKSVDLTVLELLAFNSHDRPLRTHKHTHIERTHYLCHSLRSLGGDNYQPKLLYGVIYSPLAFHHPGDDDHFARNWG